jgi:tetratricopeptide (TPR) repeat protein
MIWKILPATLAIMISVTTVSASHLDPPCAAVIRNSRALVARERITDAEALLSRFLADLQGDDACRASVLIDMANALQQLGKSEEAQQAAEESIRLIERAEGASAPLLRQPLLVLAQLAFAKYNFHRSASLLARADQLANAPHSYLATSHGLKGSILLSEGNLDGAETEFRASLEERAKAGEDKSSLAVPEIVYLAMVDLRRARPTDALIETERASRIIEHSPYSPELSINVLLLSALSRAGLRQNKEAEKDFERARKKIVDLPSSLQASLGRSVYEQYESFLRTTGRKSEAKQIARQQTQLFGPDHSSLTVSADSLLENRRR